MSQDDQNFQIDINDIRKCFEVFNMNQKDMIKQANDYLMICEQRPEFPGILLQLFDNKSEVFHIV